MYWQDKSEIFPDVEGVKVGESLHACHVSAAEDKVILLFLFNEKKSYEQNTRDDLELKMSESNYEWVRPISGSKLILHVKCTPALHGNFYFSP